MDLLARPIASWWPPVDVRRVRALLEFAVQHYRYVVLDVPRSDAAVLDALELATRIVVVGNQELATVRSASRMAGILRQRYGKEKILGGREPLGPAGGNRPRTMSNARSARRSSTRFPSDYRRALQALNKGRPVTFENHNELASSLRRSSRARSPGIEKRAGRSRPSLFGRFGRTRSQSEESKS